MKKLSLTMIVKNEAGCLARCLASTQDIVDEIIIVDTGSTDSTKEIALLYGAKLFDFTWTNDFSAARNYALSQSTGDWNLILDADEQVVNCNKQELREFIETQNAVGVIKLVSNSNQDGEEKLAQCFLSRLIPKGTFYAGIIHEQVVSTLPQVNAPVEIFHDGYLGKDKGERNLKLLLLALEQSPQNPYILYQTATQYFVAKNYDLADSYFAKCYARIPDSELYRPKLVVRYLHNIICKGNLTVGMEIIQQEQTRLAGYPDFHFVCGLFYMELVFKDQRYLNLFPLIEQEYLKCLELGENGHSDGVIGTGSFYAMYNLGTFYEVTGNLSRAKEYYRQAAAYGYTKADQRLKILG